MARQSFMWTALPNGYTGDGSSLRLSLLLSPRLDPEADPKRLQTFFPDWQDWPTTLQQARLEITYNGVTVPLQASDTAGTSRVDDSLGLPDSAVWQAIFDAERFVRPYAFKDLSDNRILSYDSAVLASIIESLYADLARNATDGLPLVSDFVDDRVWHALVSAIAEIDRGSVSQDTGLRDPARQFERLWEEPKYDRTDQSLSGLLRRFQMFHTPPATPTPRSHSSTDDPRIESRWLEYQRTELREKDDLSEEFDFHQIVAALGSYPVLLRKLGLVVDVVLAADSFAFSPDAALSAKVVFPAGTLVVATTRDAGPETRTLLDGKKFEAVSDPGAPFHIDDGLLVLDPAEFSILQFDIDGAGLKVMNFLRSLGRRDGVESRVDPVTRHEDRLGAPALRTGGLMLVHRQRADLLADRFDRNKTLNGNAESQFQGAASTVSLHAEDLVRGYRIDIWDSMTGKWRSLCRRTARYELGDGAVIVNADPEEEGTVRLGATRSADPSSNANVLYLHEALVSWTGWSLAAAPPGRAVMPDDTVDTSGTQAEAEALPDLKFSSRFKPVKFSLPRLRFGRAYQMRARAVDLAGNSLDPQTGAFGPEQAHLTPRPYLRYEPIESPIIALLAHGDAIEVPAEGESISRLAIRTFNDTPAQNTIATTQVSRRAAIPPRVSAHDAEHHGMLDGPGTVDAATFNLLANEKDVDPRDPGAAVREVTIPMKGPLDEIAVPTTFAVYEAGRALTHLPDPLAVEVAVRIFDHPNIADNELIAIPLYPNESWPEARPFTVELYDDPTAKPYFDDASRCLRVPLPKAVRARAWLSMKVPAASLDMMGIFGLLNEADKNSQRERALNGQHWMLTPWRVLELVHAVQRPLIAPVINSLSVAPRRLNATFARPVIHVTCSIDSTDRLDLHAEWHEPLDDPESTESSAGPADRPRRDPAFHVKVTDTTSYAKRGIGAAGGGFPDHTIMGPDAIAVNTETDQVINGQPPPIEPKPHEFHDTRYRRIEYWLDATTKFREFLPAALLTRMEGEQTIPVETHITVTGEPAVTWIPSSAPPPAPNVLYVVPTFGWVRETAPDGEFSSWRRGGGLRVYLDRKWSISGYGEMLGVVLPPAAFVGDPDEEPLGHPYKEYVTQWGNDPVWDSGFVSGIAPRRGDFPLARTAPDPTGSWLPPNAPATEKDQRPGPFQVTALAAPSAGSGSRVEVSPHDVFYDEVRQLWFCDIEINPGASYYPFIRLALARYQPMSVPGAHLSDVVLADMIALTADRWLNITPTEDPARHRVAVFGMRPSESSGHHEAERAPSMSLIGLSGHVESLEPAAIAESTVVEVWVEELDERFGEDFGWLRIADATAGDGQPGSAAVETVGDAVNVVDGIDQSVLRERLRASTMVAEQPFRSVAGTTILKLTPWETLWEGDVIVPAPSGRRRRLVIAEYEEYLVDDKYPYDKVPTAKDRRLVFVEHIELR